MKTTFIIQQGLLAAGLLALSAPAAAGGTTATPAPEAASRPAPAPVVAAPAPETRPAPAPAVVAAAPAAAEPDWAVSGTAGFVNNYVFRGVSYSEDEPAVQAGFEAGHKSGLYAGVWGTSINERAFYAENASVEIDTYAGYRTSVGDLALDVGVLRFNYPGAGDYLGGVYGGPGQGQSIDTNEIYAQVGYKNFSVKYSHAVSEFFGINDSEGSNYLEANANFPMSEKTAVQLHAGRQEIDGANIKINDFKIGVTHDLGNSFIAGLAYSDTSGDDEVFVSANNNEMAGSKVIASLTKSF